MIVLPLLLYIAALVVIFLYCVLQLSLIISHFNYREKVSETASPILPLVTVQLPLYNEKYVAARLIDSICLLDYPKTLLEIQVLDDSDDETTVILEDKLKEYQSRGFDIQLIRRAERKGFKAGALAYGLEKAKGEFIAIFDADFMPTTDFLLKTVPLFSDQKTGTVQTRWGHINEDYSLLTRLQAFGLDAHFFIEQTGREAGNHFLNFNGTAGIWRKQTILDAGGWSPDTLTEDLDLSYRAQLKGWKIHYLKTLESPAELPVTMPAIKSQQYRWMKGGAECFVKNASRIRQSQSLSLWSKIQGYYHLLNSSVFLAVVTLALSSVPLVIHAGIFDKYKTLLNYTALFQVNWLILGAFYWLAFREKNKNPFLFTVRFLLFLTFMMGLALHNSIAVLEGYLGRKTPFVRTPKFNVLSKKDSWQGNRYTPAKIGALTYWESAIALLFLLVLVLDVQRGIYGMIPFHSMVFLGYFMVVFYTIRHALSSR